MHNHSIQYSQTNHDEIARCAYLLWEQAGRPVGRDQELWFMAESRFNRSTTASPLTSQPAPATAPAVSNRPAASSPATSAPKLPVTTAIPAPASSKKRRRFA